MKVKLIHMAILMFFVMSVMFLAQTQNGIGHDDPYDPNDPKSPPPHKPPGHTHLPSIYVDNETGEPKKLKNGGVDPHGNHYSGDNNVGGEYSTAWGFEYSGGTYADSPTGLDNDKQNVWYIRVDTVASTGRDHASLEVTPSIYLTHYDKKEASWQGHAEGRVSFSGACFHVFGFSSCVEYSKAAARWPTAESGKEYETGYLDLVVKNAEITEGEKKEYGGGLNVKGVSLTANSAHMDGIKYNDLHAQGYRFLLKLKAGFINPTFPYENKVATGNGHLINEIVSNTATAQYIWPADKWRVCPCGESHTPISW